jgi:uncharacterized membrane protein YqhA
MEQPLIVIVAVIASMLAAFGMFYLTTIDVYNILLHLTHYHALSDVERIAMKADTVAHVVGAVDGYLLGTILLIFAMGLYELFISDIDAVCKRASSKILTISNLDDLKDKLAKVIMMILVVTFFEKSILMDFQTPLDLLYFAVGVLLVALALYFSHMALSHKAEHEDAGHEKDSAACDVKK